MDIQVAKFRGKRKLNGDWVYGYYYHDTDENFHYIVNNDDGDLTKYRVIPDTVDQYIGIKDNSEEGVSIYQGDILEFGNGDRCFVNCEDNCLHFYPEWIGEPECDDQGRDLYRLRNAIVIGNVYQDPELLSNKQ